MNQTYFNPIPLLWKKAHRNEFTGLKANATNQIQQTHPQMQDQDADHYPNLAQCIRPSTNKQNLFIILFQPVPLNSD